MTDVVSLIHLKRDNTRPLTDAEIGWLFAAYAGGEVADEQMAALLMAIYFNGLDGAELRAWTGEMIASGERLDLTGAGAEAGSGSGPGASGPGASGSGESGSGASGSGGRPRPSVDKHSTGGVGDKVSLVLAPLVASCGAVVPMLSGRGLGHTGGTLDKLESIPGWRASLGNDELTAALAEVGAVIAAAGDGLAPADRRLYALRDVTGTVESIPLIASSIMSKKIAEGTGALVLDVKTGTGAFMQERDRALDLARTMVALGEEHGVRTRALVTRMDTPLGRSVGNALEVGEAIEALRGEGPEDLMEVTFALAAQMLELAGLEADPRQAIASGRALEVFRRMIKAQGGDPDAPLPRAAHQVGALPAAASGWVTRLDARAVGVAAWRLGAGRARKEDPVSHTAGVRCLAKPGEYVEAGQPVLELHADDPGRFAAALEAVEGAVTIGTEPPARAALIVDQVGV
jgi:thymidine phosphorylase